MAPRYINVSLSVDNSYLAVTLCVDGEWAATYDGPSARIASVKSVRVEGRAADYEQALAMIAQHAPPVLVAAVKVLLAAIAPLPAPIVEVKSGN